MAQQEKAAQRNQRREEMVQHQMARQAPVEEEPEGRRRENKADRLRADREKRLERRLQIKTTGQYEDDEVENQTTSGRQARKPTYLKDYEQSDDEEFDEEEASEDDSGEEYVAGRSKKTGRRR